MPKYSAFMDFLLISPNSSNHANNIALEYIALSRTHTATFINLAIRNQPIYKYIGSTISMFPKRTQGGE